MNKKLYFPLMMAFALGANDTITAKDLFSDEVNLKGAEMIIQTDNVG